jgi:hypothetical protein
MDAAGGHYQFLEGNLNGLSSTTASLQWKEHGRGSGDQLSCATQAGCSNFLSYSVLICKTTKSWQRCHRLLPDSILNNSESVKRESVKEQQLKI